MLEGFYDIDPQVTIISEHATPPAWGLAKIKTTTHSFTCVINGQAVYNLNGLEYHVKKGDLIYIPPSTIRIASNIPEDPVHVFAIHFTCSDNGENVNVLPFPTISTITITDDLLNMFSIANKMWTTRSESNNLDLFAKGIALSLVSLFSMEINTMKQQNYTNKLRKIINHIKANLTETISINNLANIVQFSPVYFGAWFKENMGITVNQYITDLRISRAYSLLRSGEYNISTIAYMCGFKDVYYFSNTFKKKTGKSPLKVLKK